MRKQLIFWIFLSVILSANEEKLVEKEKKYLLFYSSRR